MLGKMHHNYEICNQLFKAKLLENQVFSRAFQKLLDSYLGASKQIEVSNAGGRLHQTRQKLHNWRSTVRD